MVDFCNHKNVSICSQKCDNHLSYLPLPPIIILVPPPMLPTRVLILVTPIDVDHEYNIMHTAHLVFYYVNSQYSLHL